MPQEWFAFQIRDLRFRMGMTQREFADLLDVSASTISKWERGAQAPDCRDWDHLHAHYVSERSIFVTRDEGIQSVADELREWFGVVVLDPEATVNSLRPGIPEKLRD